MKINPISFKGIYNYKLNTEKNFKEIISIANMRPQEEDAGLKIVIEHQNYEHLLYSIGKALKESKNIPSENWLLRHAELKGIELPESLTGGDLNIYFLTEKDKDDYEKTVIKREKTKNRRKIIKKLYKEVDKNKQVDDTAVDIFLKRISAYAQSEKKVFQEFLKGKDIQQVEIDFIPYKDNKQVNN